MFSCSSDISIITFNNSNILPDLFYKIEFYRNNLDDEQFEYILLHIIEEIIFNVHLECKKKAFNNISMSNPLFNSIVIYISQNITSSINVDTICSQFHISSSYLFKLFIKNIGISPKKYILSKKLFFAQQELKAGKKPTEVYITCGFTDYSVFYKNYKNEFGHSPSEEISSFSPQTILS